MNKLCARLGLLLTLAAASCGTPERPVPDDAFAPQADLARGLADLARHADLATVCGPCAPPTPVCDAPNKKCVGCLVDADCADQFICANKACVPGCAPGHANCGDAGSCDVDMKLCHGCLADTDCKDPRAPFCDLVSGRCGACTPQNDRCPAGTYCGMSNGAPACLAGCKNDAECQFADGGTGTSACCAHQCADTRTSPTNCGACGTDCKGNACCAGACVDTAADVKNCGVCGKVCPSANNVPTCMNGACGAGPCAQGFADCNGNPGDGCETATGSDPKNCGGCGKTCNIPNASSLCLGGTCQIGGCNTGFRNCNGDASDGCEVNTGSDPKNCGQCGQNCAQLPNAVAACMNGGCVIGACAPGFGNCNKMDIDGCESPLAADPLNCGACGNVCPAPPNVMISCVNQVCGKGGCNPGFADCNNNMNDGCEAKPAGDPRNCGACGNVCPAPPNGTAVCNGGTCGLGACNAGFGDCNMNPADGCEINLNTNPSNCGKCGTVCPNGQSCVAGVCTAPYPAPCTTGKDVSGSNYVICAMNANGAWIAGNNNGGGCTYAALAICQKFGYTRVTRWGGTCGAICGYCNGATCNTQYQTWVFGGAYTTFDSGGGNPQGGGNISCTVQWECAP